MSVIGPSSVIIRETDEKQLIAQARQQLMMLKFVLIKYFIRENSGLGHVRNRCNTLLLRRFSNR